MIKKENKRLIDIKENHKEGKGTIRIKHCFTQNEFSSSIRHCSETIIPKGCSIGLHKHVQEEEIYIISQGKGLIRDLKNTYEVVEGDTLLTKSGETHSIENIGDEDLRIIAFIVTY